MESYRDLRNSHEKGEVLIMIVGLSLLASGTLLLALSEVRSGKWAEHYPIIVEGGAPFSV